MPGHAGAPLVVGVDGSPDSVRALDWAVTVAEQLQLPVRVMQSAGQHHHGGAAEQLLAEALERRDAGGLEATAVQDDRDPVTMLVEAGRGATAAVLGSRGHGRVAGALSGSVSQHVAHLAPCPVVVVREPADPAARTVVLGVDESPDDPFDFSAGARHAADFAFWLAEGTGAPLTVLRAWQDQDLDRSGLVLPLKAELDPADRQAAIRGLDLSLRHLVGRHPDVAVSRDVRPAHPQRLLADASLHAALVVVGSRGRGAVAGMLLGSVSQWLLQHAACPVAIVR